MYDTDPHIIGEATPRFPVSEIGEFGKYWLRAQYFFPLCYSYYSYCTVFSLEESYIIRVDTVCWRMLL